MQTAKNSTSAVCAALVEQELSTGARWLRFSSEIEAMFEADTREARIRRMTSTALVAMVLYNFFLLADGLLLRDVLWLAVIVRLGVITPISIGIYMVMRRPGMAAYRDLLAVLTVVLVTSSCGFLITLSESPLHPYYNAGIIPVIIYALLIQRYYFRYAVLCAVLVNVIFAVSLWRQQLTPFELPLALLSYSITGTVCTLFAAYTMEREHRLYYLLSLKERLHAAVMEGISNRDALTGLYNRRALDTRFAELELPSGRDNRELAIVILDIDHFKVYNDRLGHQAGDECLRQVAELITGQVADARGEAYRYGGEEFLLLLRDISLERAASLAERIRLTLVERAIPHPDSPTGPVVTASFGVAHRRGSDLSAAELVARADSALYAAKNGGRNRIFPPLGNPVQLVRDIRRA